MPVTLPTDDDGKLVQFDGAAVALLDLRRRGVRSEHDHWVAQFGPDGSSCTRRYSCAWGQRFNALIYMVGAVTSYNDPESGQRKLSRLLPQTDPEYPAWICTKCEIQPWRFMENLDLGDVADLDDGDQIDLTNPGYLRGMHTPIFDRAELKCTFELVPWLVKTDEELSPTLREQGRYVTWPGFPGADASAEASYIGLPGSVLKYATSDGTSVTGPAGVPIPFPVGFTEMNGKFKIILRRWPFNSWGPEAAMFLRVIGSDTTRGYIGSLNKTEFHGYPPLSLQLIGIEQRLLPDATGLSYSWDIGYVMQQAVKPFGHLGYYYHDVKMSGAQSGYYQALRSAVGTTAKGAGALEDNDSLFPVREFADLFKPGV